MTWAAPKEASSDPAPESVAFRIEDSRAFVGLAPVYLSVSKLRPEGGNLIGTYTISVPLMTSKNDRGKIVLPLDINVSELGAKGGVLKGKAHSDKNEEIINDIVCEVIPKKDQAIRLAITTDERTINFKSRYTVIETRQDG
ncbi:MAG: hypothetical protein ACNA77_10345 [Opitutales bacterium]